MQLKEYQKVCIDTLREYLAKFAEFESKQQRDPARAAWEDNPYFDPYRLLPGFLPSRPFVCIQVPTGGGKTLLAAHTIDLAQEYLAKRKTGLVLWVVPTQQIYKQTLKSLQTKDHPYRQVLDRSSGGRTMVIEKEDRFTPSDVEGNLVVLLLMMQSTGRETKDFLRMYRDSEFSAFFPSEERLDLHEQLLKKFPTLDTHTDFNLRQIKTSLGNTIRILQPIVILDEGHRARSLLMQETLARFNPRAIFEFTATPHPNSNVLVKITGKQLLSEEMVKLPINVKNVGTNDWRDALSAAIARVNELQNAAEKYEQQTGEYIRPICLIQVERTGKDQREKGKIHSEQVKEELIKRIGILPHEIAIQSSEKKELSEFEDANGLLTKNNHIRFIITKDALKEGWDCSFAYVLCLLNTPQARTGATQLIGRIMRQPYAKKTGVELLDEAYVISHKQNGIIEAIKSGFDNEGLIDIRNQLRLDGSTGYKPLSGEVTAYPIREYYRKAIKHFIMPTFVIVNDDKVRTLDYDTDIEPRINWKGVNLSEFVTNFHFSSDKLISTDEEFSISEDEGFVSISSRSEIINTYHRFTPEYLASEIMNIVPNPWMAYDLADKTLTLLRRKEKNEEKLRHNLYNIAESFRNWLREEKDRLARTLFFDLLKKGTIRFVFFTDSWRPPTTLTASTEEKRISYLQPPSGKVVGIQQGLFDEGAYIDNDYNQEEREVALWLDKQEQLFFWMRNYSSKSWYFLQGWKPHKIRPDFISTKKNQDGSYGFDKVYVIETKGTHLIGNPKTKYIEELFSLCNEAKPKHISELGFEMNSKSMRFELIHFSDWRNQLQSLIEE